MTAHIDRGKSFIATIGGATRPEDCFLSSFMQRRRAIKVPTEGLLQPSPEAAILSQHSRRMSYTPTIEQVVDRTTHFKFLF